MLPRYATFLSLASAVLAHKPPKGCSTVISTVTVIVTTTVTPTSTSSTDTSNISSWPDSCTYRPTQTYYSSSGCSFNCSTGFCVIDAPATVSCGCPTVFIETQTATVCPTASPCYQCHTGWGTFIYTQECTTLLTGKA